MKIIGFSGGQGSGKSSITFLLNHILNKYTPFKSLVLSIDDYYLSIKEREILAKEVHPLCLTRGVPGTHNITKLIETISTLSNNSSNSAIPIPSFSKLSDDYFPKNNWRVYRYKPDIIFVEGWCIGASPIGDEDWLPPLNYLEKEFDPKAIWGKWSNEMLRMEYQKLFKVIDLLIMIRLPSMSDVFKSRWKQELTLKKLNSNKDTLSRNKVNEFVMHFERLTRHMLKTLPPSADIIIERDIEFNYSIK